MEQQFKTMYFCPKPDGVSQADFQRRWRQHGRLAMSSPFWRQYVRYQHWDALPPRELEGLDDDLMSTVSSQWAGVGSAWLRDRASLDEGLASYPELEFLLEDEVETFGRVLGTDVVPVFENRVIDRGRPSFTHIVGMWAKPGVEREEFSARWLDLGTRLAETPALERHLVTYVQNHSLEDFEGRDGLAEVGFASIEGMSKFFGELKFSEWLAPAEGTFIDVPRSQRIVGTEHVLFDCP